jgi:hypothetical protein
MENSNEPEGDNGARCPGCGQPKPRPGDLVENLPPQSDLHLPEFRLTEEKKEINRRVIALGLYMYLAVWSAGILTLAAFGKMSEAVELAEKLALPALPLLGIVIGSYFERRG